MREVALTIILSFALSMCVISVDSCYERHFRYEGLMAIETKATVIIKAQMKAAAPAKCGYAGELLDRMHDFTGIMGTACIGCGMGCDRAVANGWKWDPAKVALLMEKKKMDLPQVETFARWAHSLRADIHQGAGIPAEYLKVDREPGIVPDSQG